VVDWSGGVLASCIPRVQLYVNACNGWPQFALQHHGLLPINCHFLRLYSAAGRGIAVASSAIEESDLHLFSLLERTGNERTCRSTEHQLAQIKAFNIDSERRHCLCDSSH